MNRHQAFRRPPDRQEQRFERRVVVWNDPSVALGRRIAKHDAFGTTFFTWEGMRLIQEERGLTAATHVYEPDSYVPLARIDLGAKARTPDEPALAARVYYLHTNINGAPEEMTDARGTLVWQARYAVRGNTVVEHWHREHPPT